MSDIRIGLFSTNTPHLNIAILVLKSSLWVLIFWGPWTLNKNFKRFRFFIGKVLKIRFCRGIVCFCTFDITANITKSLDKTSASDRTIRDRPTTVLSLVSVGSVKNIKAKKILILFGDKWKKTLKKIKTQKWRYWQTFW